MAGVKGKSGGARLNSGPKPRPPELDVPQDPAEFLLAVMRGEIVPSVAQLKAAEVIVRTRTAGKKDEQAGRAKRAAAEFSQTATPIRLVVSK